MGVKPMPDIWNAQPTRRVQIDFRAVERQTNRFRACLKAQRFGLLRALICYQEKLI